MAFFTGGLTFSPGDEVTAAKLNSLIVDAIPQNLNRSHMASDTKVVTVGTSAPITPSAGELFYDSSNSLLKLYTSSKFVGIGPAQETVLTCQENVSIGDVVVFDSSNASSVTTVAEEANSTVVGVVKEAITGAPASTRIQLNGPVTVNCDDNAISIGDYLITSGDTQGKATASSTLVDGVFARAMTVKDAGAGTVTALLFQSVTYDVPQFSSSVLATESFASVSTNTGSTSTNTWYSLPGDVNQSITAPTTPMGISFTTTVANQLIFVEVKSLDFASVDTNACTGIRLNYESGTILASWTENGAGALLGQSNVEGFLDYAMVPFVVPAAGTYTVEVQWRADGSVSGSLAPITNGKTVELNVYSTVIV